MSINKNSYQEITEYLELHNTTLVAVSKTKSAREIRELYDLGQRDFGENYVQELLEKQEELPKDIRWHFIGHLQSNKVKFIAPFVHLIHGVDRGSLIKEINKQAKRANRKIECLLQVHIAEEDSKFGFKPEDLPSFFARETAVPENVVIKGLMGMATFTENADLIRSEFRELKGLFDSYFNDRAEAVLSMGMSADYKIAVEEGSNMVRIGSLIFGSRTNK